MKKIVLLAFVLVLLSMAMFGTGLVITVGGPTTHHVYPGDSIQDTINSAQSGDTVFVHNGTYFEHVVVNKSLILVGEDRSTTVIDGEEKSFPTGHVVEVTANNVSISGFTIQNSSTWGPSGDPIGVPSGIFLNSVSGCNITGNTLPNTFRSGLTLYKSSGNVLSDNIISNGGGGIWLDGSSNNIVSGNTITNMGSAGIFLLKFSNGNMLTNNCISLSPAEAYHGICIGESSNNVVTENIITNNYRGISLGLNWPDFVEHDSTDNMIYHNSFISNTFQADIGRAFNNTWDNGYPSGGNYWSDYTDVDEKSGPNQDQPDSDGIWDHPYVIDENNQDNYPLVPEFPTWTSMLLILIVITVVMIIYKRRLLKTPIY